MRDEFFTLKAAFRRLVKACGGVEAAEAVAGVSKASISKWQSIDHDCFAPINVVLALESEVGTPVVTRELLRAQGYAAVPGEGQRPCDENLHTLLLAVTKELGGAVAAVGDMNHFPDLASFQPVEKEVFGVTKAADRLLDEVRRRRPGFCRKLRKVS